MAKLPQKLSFIDVVLRQMEANRYMRRNRKKVHMHLTAMIPVAHRSPEEGAKALKETRISLEGFPYPKRIVARYKGNVISYIDLQYNEENELTVGDYHNSN